MFSHDITSLTNMSLPFDFAFIILFVPREDLEQTRDAYTQITVKLIATSCTLVLNQLVLNICLFTLVGTID